MALMKSTSDHLYLFTTQHNRQPIWIAQTGSQAALELVYVNQNVWWFVTKELNCFFALCSGFRQCHYGLDQEFIK